MELDNQVNQTVTPAPESSPLPPTQPKSKFPLIIGGSMVLLLVGGVLYSLVSQRIQSKNLSRLPTPTISATTPPSPTQMTTKVTLIPTSSLNESKGWKTYTDENSTFMYPPNDILSHHKAYSMLSRDADDSVQISKPYEDVKNTGYNIDFVVRDNVQNISERTLIDNYITDIQKNCSPPGCSTADLIKRTLKEYRNGEIDGYTFHIGAETDSLMVIDVKNNKTYLFRVSDGNGFATDLNIAVFEKILSSLKFK